MPVKEIEKIEDQTLCEIKRIYGSINDKTLIPYICDKTGVEFPIKYGTLRSNLKIKRYLPIRQRLSVCKILEILKGNSGVRAACEDMDISISTLSKILKENGYSKNAIFLLTDEDLLVSDFESGMCLGKLCEKHHIDFYRCVELLKEKGCKVKNQKEACEIYAKKEDFFEKINNEKSAYFLGLLLADGCVSKNGFAIGLQESDIKIIQKFKNCIFIDDSPSIKIDNRDAREWNSQNFATLTCNSVKMSRDLQSLGCYKSKSLTAEVNKELIDMEYYRHIIRGFFDGDGSIFKPKNRCWVASFCTASEKMKNFIMEYLDDNKIDAISGDYQRKSKIYYIYICGREALLKFFEYIYKDCSIYLDRKFLKFIDFLIHRKEDILAKTSKQKIGKFPCFRESKTEFIFHYAKLGKDFSKKFPKSDFTKNEALLEVNNFKRTFGLRVNPENLNWPNYADLENLISPTRIIRDLNITLDDELKRKLNKDYNIALD